MNNPLLRIVLEGEFLINDLKFKQTIGFVSISNRYFCRFFISNYYSMQEKDFNRMIVASFNKNGSFSYKIPDPPQAVVMTSSPRPYDFYTITPEFHIHAESKLIKNKISSFNFNSIREHQLINLSRIKSINPETHCNIVVGYWIPRKVYEFFIFDIETILELQKLGKNSFLKKDIEKFQEADYAIKVKKSEFDTSLWTEKEINIDKCKYILGAK